jgi:hypothetical protein
MGPDNNLTIREAKVLLKNNPRLISLSTGQKLRDEIIAFQKVSKELSETLAKQFEGVGKILNEFAASFKEYGKKIRPSLITLAKHGWYICGSAEMDASLLLEKEFKKGNIGKADKFLIEFYEEEFDKIVDNICRLHPERIKVIREAKKAHRLKMYFCSTILFLSTADGIFEGTLFTGSRKGKKGNLEKVLRGIDHLTEYGELLINESAIDAGRKTRKLYKSSLNRHEVMHGGDSSYGTKLNSLKALSLLAYICDFLEKRKEP